MAARVYPDVPSEEELQQLDRELAEASAAKQQLEAQQKELLRLASHAQKPKRTLGEVSLSRMQHVPVVAISRRCEQPSLRSAPSHASALSITAPSQSMCR